MRPGQPYGLSDTLPLPNVIMDARVKPGHDGAWGCVPTRDGRPKAAHAHATTMHAISMSQGRLPVPTV